MTGRDQYEHARGNAKGWYETIRDLCREATGEEVSTERQEAITREIDEGPLSVLVREPWHQPHETPPAATEYEILLTTGGPALRIWGDLNEYGDPENARLEMQEWGVPWCEVWPCAVDEMDEARAVLAWYAGHFYFGG